MNKKVRRLAEQFRPQTYELELHVDPSSEVFSGKVTIHGQKIGRPSQRLTFHQKDLKIISAEVVRHERKGDQPIEINRINHHRGFDEVRLHSPSKLFPGQYTVRLSFTTHGAKSLPSSGLVPASIAKQLELHRARVIFPCVDESGVTAKLSVTLENQDA